MQSVLIDQKYCVQEDENKSEKHFQSFEDSLSFFFYIYALDI